MRPCGLLFCYLKFRPYNILVFRGYSYVGSSFQFSEEFAQGMRIVVSEQNIHEQELSIGLEQFSETAQFILDRFVCNMMEAAVCQNKVERFEVFQLLPIVSEGAVFIQACGVFDDTRVDIVAHILEAHFYDSFSEQRGSAAKVQDLRSPGQLQFLELPSQIMSLFQLVESNDSLGYVIESGMHYLFF